MTIDYTPVSVDSNTSPDIDKYDDRIRILRLTLYKHRFKYAAGSFIIAAVLVFTVITFFSSYPMGDINLQRSEAVKMAMKFAWGQYKKDGLGHDEIQPVSGLYNKKWGGWSVTLVDALDTLYIMDLHDEYDEARDYIVNKKFSGGHGKIIFFEMNIRVLGGLLSAYELSDDSRLLDKAKEVGAVLASAFDNPTGLPYPKIDLNTSEPISEPAVNIAQLGTFQLEFQKLSEITGNATYREKADSVTEKLRSLQKPYPGLYPTSYNFDTNNLDDVISFGRGGDSWYEYMLKQYLLNGKRIDKYKQMYVESITSMKEKLLKRKINQPDHQYVAIANNKTLETVGMFGHLNCFIPGMLALGSKQLDRPEDFEIAQDMTNLCYSLYETSPTGLPPNLVIFPDREGMTNQEIKHQVQNLGYSNIQTPIVYYPKGGYFIIHTGYRLRPETVESLFYMYRLTGDEIYREHAWEIFKAIERHTKAQYGYADYIDVFDKNPRYNHKDKMDSYFLAETLKYLYLIFCPTDKISLDKYVFNTEGHPLKIIKS